MGVRGITGALMAGPMEQTELVPFAYDQVRQRNLDLEQSRVSGMETTLELQNAMDALGTIPGTEDDAEALTKPFQDRLDKIHEQYGNDLGRAAPDLQRLAFDFMSNKSKESKELSKAGASRASLQASIGEMITAGTLDSTTGAAYLQRATSDFNTSLDAYKKGEGEMFSGNVFNGTPVATPDINADIFKIQPLIKPSTYEKYKLTAIEGRDSENNVIITGYENRETKVKYSNAEAREMMTADMLMSLDGYKEYAAQQVSLGLAGPGYDGSGMMDIEKRTNPLLQPLSDDKSIAKQQLASAGARNAAEYQQMQNIETANKQSTHKAQVAAVAEQYRITPEEAEKALAENRWNELLSEGVINDIARASRIGAFHEQTLSGSSSDAPKASSTVIEHENLPYNSGEYYTTDDIQLGSRPSTNSETLKDKLDGETEVLEQKRQQMASDDTTPEMKEKLAGEVKSLETSIDNMSKSYTPFKVVELLERVNRAEFKKKMDQHTVGPRFEGGMTPDELKQAESDYNKAIIDFYDLSAAYEGPHGHMAVDDFTNDMNFLMGMSEEDFQTRLNDPNHKLPTGTKLTDVAYMAKDLRTKFARYEDLQSLEMTADYYTAATEQVGSGIEDERVATNTRAKAIVAGRLRPTDPLNNNVYIGDVGKGEINDIAAKLIADFGGEGKPPLWSPQTSFAGFFEGKPVYLMDMAYYDKGQGPVRIPSNLMDNYTYGDQTFEETGGKRLVHLGDKGLSNAKNLAVQFREEVSHNLKAGRPEAAHKRAEMAERLNLSISYMPDLQNTHIESAISENFINSSAGSIGVVTRTVPASFIDRIIDKNNNDKVIYDPAINKLKIEKLTNPDGREEYSLFYYPTLEEGEEKHREYLNYNGQIHWGNLDDLIFGLMGGAKNSQDYVARQKKLILEGQD